MADTIRLQILGKVIDVLSADAPVGFPVARPNGLSVHRERTRPIELDALPAILVYFSDDDPKPIASKNAPPLTLREMEIAVEMRAEAGRGESPDQALDPLYAWATCTIFANERFGGLANQVIEGKTSWYSKEGDRPIASATTHFRIQYRTARIDPTSRT